MRAYVWTLGALLWLAVGFGRADDVYWPVGNEWAAVSLAEAGFDASLLEDAFAYAEREKSTGLVLLRGGKIASEHYWDGWNRDTTMMIASASKSMTSILIGMAIEEGKFRSIDQSLADFALQLKGTPKEAITLRHFLTMTTGLDPAGVEVDTQGRDQFMANAEMPLAHKPGTHWEYNTPAYHMLFRMLERATGESLDSYARRKLFGPLGMEHVSWVKREVDGVTNYYRADCSTRDMARFGLFALRKGVWNGQRLINESFFAESIRSSQDLNQAYGYLWWVNGQPGMPAGAGRRFGSLFPDCPPDAFAALGAGNKTIVVVPSLDLVVVRHGPAATDRGFVNELMKRVCAAVVK